MTTKKMIAISIFCLFGALLWGIYITRYSYDVKQNYNYDFSNSDCTRLNLDLKSGEIDASELDTRWDTAFLKVNLNASVWGHFVQPRVELSADEIKISHDFEQGTSGIRYLNLSSFIGAGVKKISLKGRNIAVNDTHAELILFKNHDIAKAKVLVIAPHPDDGEIAAYGLYSNNSDSYVVTITAGEAGGKNYHCVYSNDIKQYLKKGELRVWDSIVVPLLGGVPIDHSVNLGYFDATLGAMYLNKPKPVKSKYTGLTDVNVFRRRNVSQLLAGTNAAPTWISLVHDLQLLLEKIKPTIIVAPYPAIDRSSDHKLSTIALLEAMKKLNMSEGNLYLYTNHFVLNDYFPYGKSGSPITLPPFFDQSLYFQRISSVFLSDEKQNDKLFALEAMHDLRLNTEWISTFGVYKMFMYILQKRMFKRDNSYFRRAIRGNELFFVVPFKDIYDTAIYKRIVGTQPITMGQCYQLGCPCEDSWSGKIGQPFK